MKKIWIGIGVACALTLAGCGGSSCPRLQKRIPAAAPAGGGGTAVPDEANGGTVTGKVALRRNPAQVEDDRYVGSARCAPRRMHGAPAKSEEVVVNGNGTLKNVFVWVKSGLPDKTWQVPTTP